MEEQNNENDKSNKFLNTLVFKDKKLNDIMEELYDMTMERNKMINELIEDLSSKIESMSDAMITVPLIQSYLETNIKNSSELNKLITNIQKTIASATSEEETQQLYSSLQIELDQMAEDFDIKTIDTGSDDIKMIDQNTDDEIQNQIESTGSSDTQDIETLEDLDPPADFLMNT